MATRGLFSILCYVGLTTVLGVASPPQVEIDGAELEGVTAVTGIGAWVEVIEQKSGLGGVIAVPGLARVTPVTITRDYQLDGILERWFAANATGTPERRALEIVLPTSGRGTGRALYSGAWPSEWTLPTQTGKSLIEVATIEADRLDLVSSSVVRVLRVMLDSTHLRVRFTGGAGLDARVFLFAGRDLSQERELRNPDIIPDPTSGEYLLRVPRSELDPDAALIEIR